MALHYTDRSRYIRGLKHCARARWLAYSYKGIGLRPRAEALPLATGTAVHWPITQALQWMADYEEVPSRERMRVWIAAGALIYRGKVAARGFDEGTSEEAGFIAGEQGSLIEGLAWVAWRVLLPWLHQEFRILAVEQEETVVVGCTCGLGDGVGEPGDHEKRTDLSPNTLTFGCSGVVMLSRPDFLLQRRSDGAIGVADLKSSAYAPRDAHGEEHIVQMAFGTLGAERRLGKAVTHYYVVNLLKGKREVPYANKGESGALKQQISPLCYGWWRAGDPPFDKEEWKWEYTREKGYSKIPLWLSPALKKLADEAGMTAAEFWVMEMLPQEAVDGLVAVSPPFQRPDNLMKALVEEVVAEEREWAWKTGEIEGLEDPQLNALVRRSWDCHNFYGRSCEFVGICSQGSGWERPELLGRFVAREKHHKPEAEAFPVDPRTLGFSVVEGEEEGE